MVLWARGQDLDRRRRSQRTPVDAKTAASQTNIGISLAANDGGLFGEYGTQ